MFVCVSLWWLYNKIKNYKAFPGCSVVRASRFHCRGFRFNPWSREWPRSCIPWGQKKIQNSSITPRNSLMLSLWRQLPPTPPPLVTTDLFFSYSLPLPECLINSIIQYVAFWAWLLSLSIMKLTSICVVCGSVYSYDFHCMEGQSCLQFLAIIKKATINICTQIFM